MKIAPLSTFALFLASPATSTTSGSASSSTANGIALPDEKMIHILGGGATTGAALAAPLLPKNAANVLSATTHRLGAPITATNRDLGASGAGYYCGGAPACILMWNGAATCDQDATCPSYMNSCRASCGGLCSCRYYSLGCTGGYSTPMSCMASIMCENISSDCTLLTNAADCGTIPGCMWTPGSPPPPSSSSSGNGGTPTSSACYDDYDAIWESTQLQNAFNAAISSCEEKLDESSNVYTATCPETNPDFESACEMQGGVLRYNTFRHDCGGTDVTVRNFPWCVSPVCDEDEQRQVDRNLEDGLMRITEQSTPGLTCVDKPNPARPVAAGGGAGGAGAGAGGSSTPSSGAGGAALDVAAGGSNPSGGGDGGVDFPSGGAGGGVNLPSAGANGNRESSAAGSLIPSSLAVLNIAWIGSSLAVPGIISSLVM